jgi:hypothetical protein
MGTAYNYVWVFSANMYSSQLFVGVFSASGYSSQLFVGIFSQRVQFTTICGFFQPMGTAHNSITVGIFSH